jgi:hypothetical protein
LEASAQAIDESISNAIDIAWMLQWIISNGASKYKSKSSLEVS